MAKPPRTRKALSAWLSDTTDGRDIVRPLIQQELDERCRECQNVSARPKVLVVLRRLGLYPGAEVYSESGASVKIIELPDFPDSLPVEELLESYLPKSWKHMPYSKARNIQSNVFRATSIEKSLEYERALAWLRELRHVE